MRRRFTAAGIRLPDPVFKLDFSNGLTPTFNSQGAVIGTNRNVTVNQGYATFARGEIRISPVLTATERTYRIKFNATSQNRWNQVFNDRSNIGVTIRVGNLINGIELYAEQGAEILLGSGAFSLNTDYDVVLTLSASKASLYINGALIEERALTALYPPNNSMTVLGSSDSSSYYQYYGTISLFEFWDKPLTASQVAKLE